MSSEAEEIQRIVSASFVRIILPAVFSEEIAAKDQANLVASGRP